MMTTTRIRIMTMKITSISFLTDVPQPPKDLRVDDVKRDSVKLSWSAPADDGGSKIKGYIVERREASRTMWVTCAQVGANTLNADITKLTEGKEYSFRVSAENAIGISEPVELKDTVLVRSPFGE
jgi:titin